MEVTDQQYLSSDAASLSELLDLLEDEKEARTVYVVSAPTSDPGHNLKMDRLREVWLARDAEHPTTESEIYVLEDGRQFIRHRKCSDHAKPMEESSLLLRV